jgi:hypothetical protein
MRQGSHASLGETLPQQSISSATTVTVAGLLGAEWLPERSTATTVQVLVPETVRSLPPPRRSVRRRRARRWPSSIPLAREVSDRYVRDYAAQGAAVLAGA